MRLIRNNFKKLIVISYFTEHSFLDTRRFRETDHVINSPSKHRQTMMLMLRSRDPSPFPWKSRSGCPIPPDWFLLQGCPTQEGKPTRHSPPLLRVYKNECLVFTYFLTLRLRYEHSLLNRDFICIFYVVAYYCEDQNRYFWEYYVSFNVSEKNTRVPIRYLHIGTRIFLKFKF